jgi:tRNA threonylcarbamoyladenosine dehydratase
VGADAFSRTELILGAEAMEVLARARVAVVGLGGVGSWAAEALARSGVGGFVLVDDDSVCLTNLNRQVIATRDSLGRPKVEAMAERIRAINPEARIEARRERFGPESAERLIGPGFSYVVDAIDAVSAKIELIVRSKALGLPIVSVMGMGGKLDPTRLEVADLSATSVCPLARVMRKQLRRRGIGSLPVVYSREEPTGAAEDRRPGPELGPEGGPEGGANGGRRSVPGSTSFVPPAAGLIAASVVVRGLTAACRRPSP